MSTAMLDHFHGEKNAKNYDLASSKRLSAKARRQSMKFFKELMEI